MNSNAFINHPAQPTDRELSAALGSSRELWDRIRAELASELGVSGEEWNSYSLKAGWALRLKHKSRNMVYLSPCQGYFRVAFILGDKAMKAARATKLPKNVLKIFDEATRYPEGTAIRFDVKLVKHVELAKKLAEIKIAN